MNTRTRTPAVTKEHKAGIDTADLDIGAHDKSIELSGDMSIEELRDSLNAGSGHVDSEDFKGHAEALIFLEQKVLVRVMPSSEVGTEKIVEVFNNGTPQRFIRGEWVITKRKFVEVLARALPFSVTTPEALDGRGDKTRRINVLNGQRFPFEMKDPDPQGYAWLQNLYAQG